MNDLNLTWRMGWKFFIRIRPDVHYYLKEWKQQADRIPDEELRKQALASIDNKTFHCECGAVYSWLAGPRYREILQFIVAYQTISDYLDNLCDRSNSLDPQDFAALHEAMVQALIPGMSGTNYYRFRNNQDDGGYLSSLVKNCQDILSKIPAYSKIASVTRELADYYCPVQIEKHVKIEERVPRLQAWFESNRDDFPEIRWNEFAAAAGSTLGIFCLVAESANDNCPLDTAFQIKQAYFPWVQGLHILLDYLIDQEEDRRGGDLNFCSYYADEEDLLERLMYFFRKADASIAGLPDARFHRLINRGLLGMYLGDRKVGRQKKVRRIARKIILYNGAKLMAPFVYCWVFRHLKPSST